eukprot:TRINITY_DN22115_c0_g1_i1.p3 TRINITY_DN22115_c0_g1~~TRINITY_DN22115_c0_g1_i1.p3  ORF type:complete len:135 (+),score=35.39 TRINITY_DN22115_c0_g1_i1:54-458(+)
MCIRDRSTGEVTEDMFLPESSSIALPILMLCLPAWGLWPVLRSKCGAPVPAFAVINMSAQFVCALVWAATMGMATSTDGRWSNGISSLSIDLHVAAIFLGGWCLGHADHLGSMAMQLISPGGAYSMTPLFGYNP